MHSPRARRPAAAGVRAWRGGLAGLPRPRPATATSARTRPRGGGGGGGLGGRQRHARATSPCHPTPITPGDRHHRCPQGEEPAHRHGADRRRRRAGDEHRRGRAAAARVAPGRRAIRTSSLFAGQDGRVLPQRLPADGVHADGGLQDRSCCRTAASTSVRAARALAGDDAFPRLVQNLQDSFATTAWQLVHEGQPVHRSADDATSS